MNICINCSNCKRERRRTGCRICGGPRGPVFMFKCLSDDPEAVFFNRVISFDRDIHDCKGFRRDNGTQEEPRH